MLKKTIKKMLWNIHGGYHPEKFWDNWTTEFIKDPWQRKIHKEHLWLLKKINELKPNNILEVGCGFGRNIKFLIDKGINPKSIVGVDISRNMLKEAKSYIKNKNIVLINCDAKKLQFKDKEFDLIFIHGVFMHIKPDEIQNVVKEIKRIAKKNILSIEQNYGGNDYTFIHDYKKLYKEAGFTVAEYIKDKSLGLDYFDLKL